MLAPFHYAFVQQGMLEGVLLAVGCGLLGTWVVLRGLAFYSHAVGTAAFPGLVLADGLAFPAGLGAFAAAVVFATGVERLGRSRRSAHDSLTALVLVAALAIGVILASDVFHSGANVETLLFGSLLLVGRTDLVLAGIASGLVLLASLVLGRRWLAVGFDPAAARAVGARSPLPDAVLLLLVALVATAAVDAVGALLVSSLLVVPAASVRLVTRRLLPWQIGSVGLVAAEAVLGLWASVRLNVPPGPAIAMLGSGVFAFVAIARMLPRRSRPVLAAGAAVLLLAGCGSSGGPRTPSVVATTTQIGDWTRQVAGQDVRVHQILRPNTDPHEYEPRPADVVAVADARIVFENGDGLDAWAGKIVSHAGGHPEVVVLADRLPVQRRGAGAGAEAAADPHWWHDPRNAEAAVVEIRDALVRMDPGHGRAFRANAATYLAKVRRLDRRIGACLERLPRSERKLVTDHDAFGYFAARYGLEVVGAVVPSQTTAAQPSAGDTARLISLVRRERVRAVFPETAVSARLARTIARETGATSRYSLYGDTLGAEGSRGSTYLSMELANADAIARGLSGGTVTCR